MSKLVHIREAVAEEMATLLLSRRAGAHEPPRERHAMTWPTPPLTPAEAPEDDRPMLTPADAAEAVLAASTACSEKVPSLRDASAGCGCDGCQRWAAAVAAYMRSKRAHG